jgi:hypothetical protein
MVAMKRRLPDLDPALKALLAPGKIQRQLPPELRARVLARALAVVAEDLAGGGAPPPRLAEAAPLPLPRKRRLVRLALAGPIAVAAAAAIAARLTWSEPASGGASPHIGIVQPAPSAAGTSAGEPSRAPPPPPSAAKPPRRTRPGQSSDPFAAELGLLQRAHAAYTRGELPIALALIAEHARRFPEGRLAEQREALRVRSLAGAGRTDEAHRAAAAFARRFPRSVLAPRIAEAPESPAP